MTNLNARKIKWRVPNKNNEWTGVSVEKVPTHFLLITLFSMERKGYTKIRGVVNNKEEWIIRYIQELEDELSKRTDIDEYL